MKVPTHLTPHRHPAILVPRRLFVDESSYTHYTNSPASNPTGPVSGSFRVTRGGSFVNYYDFFLRASDRNGDFPSAGDGGHLGFRCARPQ